MDKLEKLFEMQSQLNDYIIQKHNVKFTQSEWIQKETLAMLSELAEVLDEVNFKWWKVEKPINNDALREEIVDVLHFFISMCIFSGMDANELFDRYLKKNKENFDRQDGLSSKKGYKAD